MLISYALGQTSVILRVKIPDSGNSDNSGKTGLTFSSLGLIITTIADNEANCTAYTSLASTIQDIATLGIYVAPSSGMCRFKEVDSVNCPGVYEIQLLNARYNVSNSKSLLVCIPAVPAINLAQMDAVIPLWKDDPYVAKPANFNLLNINGDGRIILQPTGLDFIIKDSYTLPQLIAIATAAVAGELSGLPSSPVTIQSILSKL